MPVYSGIEFLHSSVLSIVKQTHQDWELLIGINGHDQLTIDKINDTISLFEDTRIKIFSFQEASKSKTLNNLVSFCNSNHIALLDVDDKWRFDKLEKQIPFLNRFDVVGTNAEYFGEKTGEPGLFFGRLTKEMFSWQNPVINSSVILKKEDAYWDLEFEGVDDYNLWIELSKKEKSFYNLPEALTLHRVYKKSYFNNTNAAPAEQLLRRKLPWLTDEQIKVLENIRDNKKWDL